MTATSKQQVKPPEGWRLLKKGDSIKPGDKVHRHDGWGKTVLSQGHVLSGIGIYARRIHRAKRTAKPAASDFDAKYANFRQRYLASMSRLIDAAQYELRQTLAAIDELRKA